MKTNHSKGVVEKPSEKQKKVHSVVLNAQLKAIDSTWDGVNAGVVNDVGGKARRLSTGKKAEDGAHSDTFSDWLTTALARMRRMKNAIKAKGFALQN